LNHFKEKNLLIIAHNYNSFQKDQIEELANYFNKVYVLVRYKPIAELYRLFKIKSLQKHMKINAINDRVKPSNVLIYPMPVFYLPLDFIYRHLGIRLFYKARKIIKNEQLTFDIIHAHFAWTSGYIGYRLKNEYNVPLAITVHGSSRYIKYLKSPLWTKLINKVFEGSDILIPVSERNAMNVRSFKNTGNISVIPNGYNRNVFFPQDKYVSRKKLDLHENRLILLNIGYLQEVKGQEYLLKSVSILKENYPDILCIIIGEGELRRKLSEKIVELNISENVLMVGYKEHHEIPIWINACDLFVLPSLSEGNPTVMFETLGCGKPYVGTAVGGVPEIINSEDYGFLCRVKNPEELAEIVKKALSKKWDYSAIINYSKQFSWDEICKKIISEYSKVLS